MFDKTMMQKIREVILEKHERGPGAVRLAVLRILNKESFNYIEGYEYYKNCEKALECLKSGVISEDYRKIKISEVEFITDNSDKWFDENRGFYLNMKSGAVIKLHFCNTYLKLIFNPTNKK